MSIDKKLDDLPWDLTWSEKDLKADISTHFSPGASTGGRRECKPEDPSSSKYYVNLRNVVREAFNEKKVSKFSNFSTVDPS